MSNSVKDRSGPGNRSGQGTMLPKAERRALGKIAAQKRAKAKRRKLLLNKITRISVPIAIVAVVIGLTWWAIASESPLSTTPEAEASAEPSATTPAPVPTLPEGADPQLASKPTVAAPSGTVTQLAASTLIAGTGPAVASGQSIAVNYVGVSFTTGEEFDSSWKAGGQPFTFKLGQGGVIKGWDQGLVGVTVGSRVQLDIPSDLAYGDSPSAGYPAGALRFVVDVLSAT